MGDPLFRGEFEVIKELTAELGADGEAAKRECDKIIDKNGPPKCGGTGIKQLRENIAESKLSYEIMDDDAQKFLKLKIGQYPQVFPLDHLRCLHQRSRCPVQGR